MAVPPAFVSEVTYIDLFAMTFADFMQELMLTHASLQQAATVGLNEYKLVRFENMQWCFTISSIPASFAHASRKWRPLHSVDDYKAMLQLMLDYLGPAELVVELTNSPTFVSYCEISSVFACATAAHELDSADPVAIPMYPCFLRITSPPIVSLPLGCSMELHHFHKCADNKWPDTADWVLTQRSPTANDMLTDTPNQEDHERENEALSELLHTTFSCAEKPSSSISAQEHRLSPPLQSAEAVAELKASSLSIMPASLPNVTTKSSIARILPTAHNGINKSTYPNENIGSRRPETGASNLVQELRTLKLYLRPASSIARRYSIPFDAHVAGLNGPSIAECIRLTVPLATSSDSVTCMDLAQPIAENSYPYVDDEGGVDTLPFILVDSTERRKSGAKSFAIDDNE